MKLILDLGQVMYSQGVRRDVRDITIQASQYIESAFAIPVTPSTDIRLPKSRLIPPQLLHHCLAPLFNIIFSPQIQCTSIRIESINDVLPTLILTLELYHVRTTF